MVAPFAYNLRSVRARWVSSIVAVVGIAGTVGVCVAMLSLAAGFRAALVSSGAPENAIVRRGGATSEMESAIQLDQVRVIQDAPGVARDNEGRPLVTAEVVVIAALPKRGTTADANVQVRGVSAEAQKVRDSIRLIQGRFFKPGLAEMVVGRNVLASVDGMGVGTIRKIGGRAWTIVGAFDTGGNSFDSEVWCDANLLNETFDRPAGIFQSVTVKLVSHDAFDDFKNALTSDQRLTVQVDREREYYAGRSEIISSMIVTLGSLVTLVMATGAVIAALNTMYASVAARSREVATLRALGFSPISVVVSFVFESLLIAGVGGLVGCLLTIPISGYGVSTMNWQTFSHLAFAFRVTPLLLFQGMIFALIMGFFGGLFPAIRAARLPVASALREL
jgi:putative ABC transport system permease protein